MIPQQIDHEARQSRLHATDVAAILGIEGARKSAHEVWLEKTGRLEPSRGNNATEAGKYLESSILDFAESELGPLKRNVVCEAAGLSFPLAATLDSQLIATGQPVEAKSTGIVGPVFGEWGEDGSDIVPQTYLVQVTVQMICSCADFAHLYALIGGRGFARYRIFRDDEVAKAIIERCDHWWNAHVVGGIEPTITEPIPLAVLKRIRREPRSEIALYDDAIQAVTEWEAAKAAKSAAEKTLEAAQSKLVTLLGDAEAGRLEDGRLVTYLQTTRRGYTVDETTFRTLRIKKG